MSLSWNKNQQQRRNRDGLYGEVRRVCNMLCVLPYCKISEDLQADQLFLTKSTFSSNEPCFVSTPVWDLYEWCAAASWAGSSTDVYFHLWLQFGTRYVHGSSLKSDHTSMKPVRNFSTEFWPQMRR